ncbi:erythrocyte membrane protein 1, PfEMP1 [Plasmodium sp. DRC-Itaito]|nr:erythrocyte membrane protein 1, PfEMP1 [Plasmodium sp. DRC-Itaito]
MAAQKTPSVDEYNKATSAKELLDLIGEAVHKQVGKEESEYRQYLHGSLSKVKFSNGDIIDNDDPCKLNYRYHTTVTNSEIDPCDKRLADRFSDEGGGECATSKIKGNNEGIGGACAPYRRLHLCDRNLEQIQPQQVKNTDKLLVDVCMAAKFEGDSISGEHSKHRATHTESHSQLCTELARSFADIGDIIRGRDLYLGRKKKKEGETEREKLENKLKEIFKEIYDKLIDDIKDNGAKKKKAEQRYNRPAEYFKLREDWWEANRETVWKAITCGAGSHAYFRRTCAGGASPTTGQCRCAISDVPTYFDYVPQYLRWFEEWAEDFCRKKKQKVENAIKKCRNKYEEKERYCSLNGFDCTQTVRARGKLRYGNRCIDCLYACNPYHEWIDNQRKQFDKQKKKYQTEIGKYGNAASGTGRSKRNIRSNNKYEGYEKKFYEEITKSERRSVGAFLDLLSAENECTNIKDDKEGKINFKEVKDGDNNDNEGTFYRSEYCQPCPLCGVERNGMSWREKKGGQCTSGKFYEITTGAESTDIDVLSFGDKPKGIKKKMDTFCDKNDSDKEKKELYESWKCYKDEDVKKDVEDEDEDENEFNAGGVCIWKNEKEKVSEDDAQEFQKTFNDFFYFWIRRFLNDSIEWRNEHGKCINNKNTCTNKCHGKCKCFLKWVEQKRKEWNKIVNHFKAQGDLAGAPYYTTLEYILKKDELLEFIEDIYGNTEETEHIKEMLRQEGRKNEGQEKTGAGAVVTENNTTIDKLLGKEKKDAEDCIQKQEECNKQRGDDGDPRRSLPSTPTGPRGQPRSEDHQDIPRNPTSDYEEDEEEDDNEGGSEETEEVVESGSSDSSESPTDQETTEVVEGPQTETATPLDVCPIVKDALTKEKLQDACKQKYNYPNAHLGWKCVTPSGSNTSTSGDAHSGEATPGRGKRSLDAKATTPSANKGGLCVPPRRRKLYLHTPLPGEAVTGEGQEGQAPEVNDTTLRDWFVKSAAIETYFLWHNFKQQKKREKKEKEEAQDALVGTSSAAAEQIQKDLQNELEQNGKIPDDFKRQMFYTLGDYRDILVGISADVTNALKKSFIKPPGEKIKDQEAENDILGYIDKKITAHINSLNSSETPPPRDTSQSNSEKNPRSTLWEQYGPKIWEGMVCALTYKENGNDSPNRDQNVYEKIFGDTTSEKTPPKSSTSGGTYEQTYKYDIVELEASGSTEPITTGNTDRNAASGTKLETFVEYPTFFRWLHEWGNEFCQKRAQQLKKIKEECRGKNYGDKYCGGDGHNCTETGEHDHNDMFAQPNCPRCYEHCLKYRQWIDRKFFEFHEQKGKYQGEYGKLKGNSGACVDVTNKFCGKIKTLTTAAQFLESLKHCKHVEDNDRKSAEEKKNNKIDFNEPQNTFSRSTYCKTCPPTKVTCNGKRGSPDPCKKVNDNGEKWQAVFGGLSGNTTKNINLEMIDRRWPFIKNYSADSNDSFKDSFLFRGFRKQKWECRFDRDNSMGVCKLDQFNDKIDLNEYTTFKVLLLYWLEDFLYGYYTLKKKHLIKKCTENEETCTGESPKKCACVKEWIDTKKNEWNRIKELFHHLEPADRNDTVVSMVKNFLQTLLSRIAPKKHNGEVTQLSDLEKSLGCHCTRESKQQNGLAYDAVGCLLDKLKEKIKTCETQSSGTECTSPTETPPDDEEEEDPPLEDQNPEELNKMMPKFCEKVVKPAETATTDVTCEAAPSPPAGTGDNGGTETANGPEVHAEEEEKQPVAGGSGTPPTPTKVPEAPKEVVPEKKVPVPPPKKPEVPPTKVPEVPRKPAPEKQNRQRGNRQQKTPTNRQTPPRLLQKPDVQLALSSSTLAWCIGISITGLSYWALLKRKPKPTVKLFSVIDIPKGEYDMPTIKSKNRYIPYKSAQYRGKRYIYIEGDSGTDSGYTDHYSDITSSSESEYEEIDLHVPHVPPKYKTLIEVVLEPSKRDTQSDIPNSDTPPTNKPINDDVWNQLKDDFISNMLQNEQKDIPNNNISGSIPTNTQPNILHDNVDEKPFIMTIHDRNLLSGEEISYDMINSGIYPSSSNRDSYSGNHGSYSGTKGPYSVIDLINDALSRQPIDIYDEMLKRKENELFGTENTKHTNTYSVAKNTNSDPILNQINLFHKWLDRHRDMCEKWNKNNKEEMLDKLKEEWENETHSGKLSDTLPSDNKPSCKLSDIHPSDNNKHSDVPHVLNTDVSLQIHIDNPKPTNQFTNMDINSDKSTMDNILDEIEKYNESYFDIYEDDKPSVDDNIYVDHNNMDNNNAHVLTKVQTEINSFNNNTTNELLEEEYPISDMWDI